MDNEVFNIYLLAEELCEKAGIDFLDSIEYYSSKGYIIQTPSSLAMFEYMSKVDGMVLHVFLLIGDGVIPYMLSCMPLWVDKISFDRETPGGNKSRVYDTERLCRLFGVDPEPLKLRCIPTSYSGTLSPHLT